RYLHLCHFVATIGGAAGYAWIFWHALACSWRRRPEPSLQFRRNHPPRRAYRGAPPSTRASSFTTQHPLWFFSYHSLSVAALLHRALCSSRIFTSAAPCAKAPGVS